MEEEMLVFEGDGLMEDLLSGPSVSYTHHDPSLQRFPRLRAAQHHFQRDDGTLDGDGKEVKSAEENAYAREQDHYSESYDRAHQAQQDASDANTFVTSMHFDDLGSRTIHDPSHSDSVIDVNPKINDHREVPSVHSLSDVAPSLSYEGSINEASDPNFGASASDSGVRDGDQSDVACPVLVNEGQHAGYAVEDDDSQMPGSSEARPSTSVSEERWTGANPLRRFSVLIGHKKLTFKVVDAPRPHSFSREDGLLMEEIDGSVERKGQIGLRTKCFVCGKMFPNRDALRDHQATHPGSKPQMCSFCGRSFFHKQSLVMHERMHTGEKPFQCPICTKCFARQTNYNIHMKLHASGRRYFCSFCGKWFRAEQYMLEHQQQCLAQLNGVAVHTDRPLRYQCSYCEKMFHHRRDKNIHERTHTGERPYSCGYCGKGFTQSQALTIHIRTHTGERPYTCSLCSKDFRDSSALRKHEFIKHTNMRIANVPYAGDVVMMPGPPLLFSEHFQPVTPSFHAVNE